MEGSLVDFRGWRHPLPISEKMGGRTILKMCVWVVLRCISVRFLDLQPLKMPNFLCSRLRRSRVTLWPTYLKPEQNKTMHSWARSFDAMFVLKYYDRFICISRCFVCGSLPKKSKFPSLASRAQEIFRYTNKVFASTFICRFVSWAWGVVVPQEWVWQLINDFTFNSQ